MIEHIDVYKQNHIRTGVDEKEIHIDPFRSDLARGNADFVFINNVTFVAKRKSGVIAFFNEIRLTACEILLRNMK